MSPLHAVSLGWLADRARAVLGIDIDALPLEIVLARLAPVAGRVGAADVWELLDWLQKGRASLEQETLESLANHETTFFRDPAVFHALSSELIPQLMALRSGERKLRLWSAACAYGQEPYSLAMMLADDVPELATWDVEIVASDASEQALTRARRAVYTQAEVNRGLPASKLLRHFTKRENEWHLDDEITRRVRFVRINLTRALPELPSFDVILLRNVLIYFSMDTKRGVLRRVSARLREAGIVALGAAETTRTVDDAFDVVHAGRATVFRTRGGRAP